MTGAKYGCEYQTLVSVPFLCQIDEKRDDSFNAHVTQNIFGSRCTHTIRAYNTLASHGRVVDDVSSYLILGSTVT